MNLKPYYTTRELSYLLGRNPRVTRRVLKNLHITGHKVGKQILFYISDMKETAPHFYLSLLEVILTDDVVIDH
jgi:hypothetical protein